MVAVFDRLELEKQYTISGINISIKKTNSTCFMDGNFMLAGAAGP